MKQVTNYINAVAQHINAGKTLRQALDALKPIYNKATFEDQQAIKMQVAQLIAKEYKVKPITTNRGAVGFDRTTKQGDAARKLLAYYFPTTSCTTNKKVSKQVDVVESLLAKVYALPKADRARFIALIKQDSK
jgi:hypothetical protein